MAESAKTGSAEFGEMLREARERLGMSRRNLAEATGLSYPYISQIETGYRMPSTPAIRALADSLGLRPDNLFNAIPTAPRDAASPSPTTTEAARLRAPGPTPRPPAAPAAPAALPIGTPAGAPGDRADGMSIKSAAGGYPAAGGSWIQNRHHAPSAGGSAPGADARRAVHTLSAGVAAPREPHRNQVVDEVAALLTALPTDDRLTALGAVQERVIRSVVDDTVRDST